MEGEGADRRPEGPGSAEDARPAESAAVPAGDGAACAAGAEEAAPAEDGAACPVCAEEAGPAESAAEPAGDGAACAACAEEAAPAEGAAEPAGDGAACPACAEEAAPAESAAEPAEDGADDAERLECGGPRRGEPAVSAVLPERHTLGVAEIRKRFGRKEVVRGVNFTMCNGEVAGLLGPNGAGKTTIFYMIVGFYKPYAGSVNMDGIDITALPMFRRARMGIAYLPQEPSIFRKLTVEQNVWAILESRRDIGKAAKKERLEQLLGEFGIDRVRRQLGFTLSGGERRRTEIARALATEPKFLLLDEPFAGIDPIAVYEIKQIIRRLADRGIGILITDHNVRDTLEITTEAFIIADGTIVARGDRDAILENEMVREVYLGSEFRM